MSLLESVKNCNVQVQNIKSYRHDKFFVARFEVIFVSFISLRNPFFCNHIKAYFIFKTVCLGLMII